MFIKRNYSHDLQTSIEFTSMKLLEHLAWALSFSISILFSLFLFSIYLRLSTTALDKVLRYSKVFVISIDVHHSMQFVSLTLISNLSDIELMSLSTSSVLSSLSQSITTRTHINASLSTTSISTFSQSFDHASYRSWIIAITLHRNCNASNSCDFVVETLLFESDAILHKNKKMMKIIFKTHHIWYARKIEMNTRLLYCKKFEICIVH